MARKKTTGYEAQNLRRKGQRRIKRLQDLISNDNTTERVRNWAEQQVKEISSAMQGTRQYSKSGKRDKSKTESYIKGQISRLEAAIENVAPVFESRGDSFIVTQTELNRASSGTPSIYTNVEARLFYKVTQKLWQREGVGEHDRNVAILEHYNESRIKKGLEPMSLAEVVEYVLNANKLVQKFQDLDPSSEMTEEQRKLYEQWQTADGDDNVETSPLSGITARALAAIRDAMESLYTLPDPLSFE